MVQKVIGSCCMYTRLELLHSIWFCGKIVRKKCKDLMYVSYHRK